MNVLACKWLYASTYVTYYAAANIAKKVPLVISKTIYSNAVDRLLWQKK